MAQYTKEEIKVFEDKELRIVRQSILKKLIEKCKLEDVYGVTKIIELTEDYVDYVYTERRTKEGQADSTKPDWEQLAIGLKLAIPNAKNIKILNSLWNEYKQANKASVSPSDILFHIIDWFGKYPTKQESIKTILESLED